VLEKMPKDGRQDWAGGTPLIPFELKGKDISGLKP
jgi:hypothetical protein